MRRSALIRPSLADCVRYGSPRPRSLPPIRGAAPLAVDPSTPAIKGVSTGSTSIVSNSFSPPAGSLLVVGVGHTSSTGLSAFAMTDSLASPLTYVEAIAVVEGTNHIYPQIWLAQVGAAPGAMTITASWTGTTSFRDAIGVLVFTGAADASLQFGATSTATASGGSPAAPSGSLTTTAGGSWVLGWAINTTNATAPTIPGGQTDVFNGLTMLYNVGEAFWLQSPTASPTASAGTVVTINDTAPSVEYAMVLLEILAAAGGAAAVGPPFFPSRMPLGV